MQKIVFQTAVGEAWLWSDADTVRTEKPLVLFINGAFSIERPRSFELPGLLPSAAVVNAHLPGNHCPRLVSHSVDTYAAAYVEALAQIDRPTIVIGASIGALVALSMKSELIKGIVLLEPPLQTEKLWCLVDSFRAKLMASPRDGGLREFLWNVFGISETALENRDYRPLLDGLSVPGWAAFGGLPLMPPRPIETLPSLVDEPERALIRDNKLLKVEIVPTVGHNVPGQAISYVRRYTQDLIDRLMVA